MSTPARPVYVWMLRLGVLAGLVGLVVMGVGVFAGDIILMATGIAVMTPAVAGIVTAARRLPLGPSGRVGDDQ
ncbi:MAG TPA: hypothetical protein H9881_08380 [Candidatus Stackebrandtia excrementipullorum]|nr:hypothetical protein [Candidatus Stackebrandtia excrementipullorum]